MNASEPALAPPKTLTSEASATTNSDGTKGEGLQEGLSGAGAEENDSYAEDFTPDNDEDNDKDNGEGRTPGLGRGVEAGVEESGSYADDFAEDGDEPCGDGGNEEDRGGTQQGAENQRDANASAAIATLDTGRGSTKGSAEAPSETGSFDVPGPESDVERRKDESPEVLIPRASNAAAAQRSSGEIPTERDLEEGYEDEFLEEESVDQGKEAEVEVAESIQPIITAETEQSHPPASGDTSAEDNRASTTRARPLRESSSVVRERADSADLALPEKEGCRRPSGETANNPTLPDVPTPKGSEGCGRIGADLAVEAVGKKVGDDSPRELPNKGDNNPVKASPLEPIPTLIVVDPLGNMGKASTHEGSASGFDEASAEGFEDYSEASAESNLAASRLAAAAVAEATGSALELVSERSEAGLSDVGADDVSGPEVVVFGCIGEEKASSAGGATAAASTQNPSPTERRRSSEEGAALTGGGAPEEDCFEGSFEDDTDENDAANSAADGTVASSSEVSSFVGGTDVPPSSLPEQGDNERPNTGCLVGDQAKADGDVVEARSDMEKDDTHEPSTTEYADFEDDFDEDFQEDVDEDIASGREPVATATATLAEAEGNGDEPVEEVRYKCIVAPACRRCKRIVAPACRKNLLDIASVDFHRTRSFPPSVILDQTSPCSEAKVCVSRFVASYRSGTCK